MRFSSEELNIARQCLFDRVVEYFLAREGVEALYLQGSIAAGSADEFSDLDFRVVIQPEVYEQYISERFSAPKHWGDWLYNEWAGRSWVCVSHFKPFNKVDVLYFKPKELQPSPWFLLPTQVIYDSQGMVEKIIKASQGLKFIPEIGEVERLLSKGLAYAEEVYRRVMRNELFYAQSLLDGFRGILMQLDDYFRNSPSLAEASASHFEQRGSKTLVKELELSYTVLEQQSILYALGVLLNAYQHQVIQLYEILPLQRDRETDLSWIDTMLELRISKLESQ
jgi:predicted nucleotidyltransferase